MKAVCVYESVSNAVIAALERGVVPWIKPMASADVIALPHNAASLRPYRGINVLLLWSEAMRKGYRASAWLSARQVNALEGRMPRGQKATRIVSTETSKTADTDPDTGEMRWLRVLNIEQTEGLLAHLYEAAKPKPLDQAIGQAAALIEAIGADVRHGGTMACYDPDHDCIALPYAQEFESASHYYTTLLHEHAPWTGHPSRLNRNLCARFGTEAFIAEELIAEISTALLCAALGIPGRLRHAEHIDSWLRLLKKDRRAIFTAASLAQQASDYLLAQGEAAREVHEPRAALVTDRFASVTPVDLSDVEHASLVRLALASLAARHPSGTALTSPSMVRDYLQLQLGSRRNEVFGLVFLDNKHRVLRFEEMFHGTIDGTSVHPRVVVQRSLEMNAAAVIMVHNHPSGVTDASEADKSLTRRLKDALALIEIRVLDHFIVSAEGVVSFSEQGLL